MQSQSCIPRCDVSLTVQAGKLHFSLEQSPSVRLAKFFCFASLRPESFGLTGFSSRIAHAFYHRIWRVFFAEENYDAATIMLRCVAMVCPGLVCLHMFYKTGNVAFYGFPTALVFSWAVFFTDQNCIGVSTTNSCPVNRFFLLAPPP